MQQSSNCGPAEVPPTSGRVPVTGAARNDIDRRRPIRILFCETNVDGTIGGSYYSLLYLVKGLDRARYRATVLFYADHGLIPAFREAGAETLIWRRGEAFTFGTRLAARFGALSAPAIVAQRAVNLLRGYVWPAFEKARFLRANDIDIVHLNNSILYNHDWMMAAKIAGTICVSHERGINGFYPAPARFFGKRLHAIICISSAVQENMRERGAGFENLVTIHNGLDPRMMRLTRPPAELRVEYGIEAAAPVVAMVGNIKEWKGQETVVRAIARVRQTCPDIRCLFVGDTSPADREYERKLKQLVSSLALDAHIIFTGFQDNVADFLMMSDVVVHASVLPEPFGRVILEAMACKKPVIGSGGGAIPELVVEGETGWTFPPGDSERLASTIVGVVGDRSEAQRLGQNGYHRLNKEFHIDRNVEQTQRLYRELLSANV